MLWFWLLGALIGACLGALTALVLGGARSAMAVSAALGLLGALVGVWLLQPALRDLGDSAVGFPISVLRSATIGAAAVILAIYLLSMRKN